MVELKTNAELDRMRAAGRVVGHALSAMRDAATVGTRLTELDELAGDVIRQAGAKPSFLHYLPHFAATPFPATVCASVNDVIVHGIPDRYRLRDGDLVSVDCGAVLDGWHGDAAITFTVGTPHPADLTLMADTKRALDAGIAAAVVGARLGDVSNAIGQIARAAGYGLPTNFGGHGIGRRMHEDPPVDNEGRPGRGVPLRHGLALAIEPMFLAGGRDHHRLDRDGWTVRTADGSRAAHFEHSIAITDDGPQVLTAI